MIVHERISEIFKDCLLRKAEIVKGKPACRHTKVQSVGKHFSGYRIVFSEERVSQYANEIDGMLDQLQKGFKENSGGGMTLKEACVDAEGKLWTEKEGYAEELMMLGIATGRVHFRLARNQEDTLLPGTFFLAVKDKPKPPEDIRKDPS